MKKILLLNIIALFTCLVNAQNTSLEATISHISFEKLEVTDLYGATLPSEGQEVLVYKVMENGFFSGTYELVKGTVSLSSNTKIIVEPEEYLSTLVEDSVERPMAKVGQTVLIKWEDENVKKEAEEEFSRLQNIIYDAQDLLDEGNSEGVIELLLPEDEAYEDCYACSFLLGRAYLDEYEEDKAIEAFTKVIDYAGDEYSMAYIYRAKAYENTYPHRYGDAIKDYRAVMSYIDNEDDEIYVLEKIIYQYEMLEDFESACNVVSELAKITPETQKIEEYTNHYCSEIVIPEYSSIRFDASIVSQSEDLNTIEIQLEKEAQNCFYLDWHGLPDYLSKKEIETGSYFTIGTCSEDYNMADAIVQIKSIKNGIIELEVMYWTGKINGHPWRNEYPIGDNMTLAW
ncbi:MAG: hypothetical protein ACPG4Z_06390 [Chitinophagales bacterium]